MASIGGGKKMVCKGKCTNPIYKPKKLVRGLEKTGYAKCTICCIYIEYAGLYCPCCGIRVSRRTKNAKYRRVNIEQ